MAKPSGTTQRLRFENIIWLMPVAFAIHSGEEWFGGLPSCVSETLHGSQMSPEQFLLNKRGFGDVRATLVPGFSDLDARPVFSDLTIDERMQGQLHLARRA
jgi:hypothetical protein